jgi:peroxiredoxin
MFSLHNIYKASLSGSKSRIRHNKSARSHAWREETDRPCRFQIVVGSAVAYNLQRNHPAWGKKSLYGKTYEGIIRSSFLIDESGGILQASYKVKPQDTVPNARKALA